MIGRAALINPLIFQQIKEKVKTRKSEYDPILNDPNLIIKDFTKLSETKKQIILEFIDLAEEHNLRKDLLRGNLAELLGGVSGSKEFLKEFVDISSVRELFLRIF